MASVAATKESADLLRHRRASIETVFDELEALGPGADPEQVAAILSDALEHPTLGFLSDVEGGSERVVTQAVQDYVRFTPNPASNAKSAAGLVRILLLQNVDLLWWDDVDDFEDDASLERADLLDLRRERRRGRVDFSFGIASDGIVRRGRDFLVQRLAPDREPRGPGLACTKARPAMLGLLNEVAHRVAEEAPTGTPPIRVNSIVRTVEHQHHLRTLGFSALSPSAHCRGWAADIEVDWFARFGADSALREVLLDYLDNGLLNVIDEGRAWHVCLNPEVAEHYAELGTHAGRG
jgi:hypothetical protein